MTYSKKEMLHQKMGSRLKQLAKEHGLTREAMGEIINYSCGHISRFYKGTLEIPDNVAQILSDLWHIRKEYILCEDDFKTDDEMYLYLNENSIKDMQAALDYLKTLGLILRPSTSLHIPLNQIYKHFSQLQEYIKDSEIERLKKEYNFELSPKEFTKTYFSKDCSVELSSPLPNTPFLYTEELSKKSKLDSMFFLRGLESGNFLDVNYEIYLFFKVYYHGNFIRTVNINKLQEFIEKLDAYSRCTIETILFDNKFGSHYKPLN